MAEYDPTKSFEDRLIEAQNPGGFARYSDVVRATAERNAKATAGKKAPSLFDTVDYNPQLTALFDSILGGISRNVGAADKDFEKYLSSLNRANADAGAFLTQENDAIGRAFTDLPGELSRLRGEAAGRQGTANKAASNSLTGLRNRLENLLAQSRGNYTGEAQGLITSEEANRANLRNKEGRAFRTATDLAIADAGAADNAAAAAAGYLAPSGLRDSIAINQRVRANTALAQTLAERERADATDIAGLRRGLSDRLFGVQRGDIGALGDVSRADTLLGIGRDDALNSILNGASDDLKYTTGVQSSLAGLRAKLSRDVAAGMLTPIQARQQLDAANLQLVNQASAADPRDYLLNYFDKLKGAFGGGRGDSESRGNPGMPFFPQGGGGGNGGGGGGGGNDIPWGWGDKGLYPNEVQRLRDLVTNPPPRISIPKPGTPGGARNLPIDPFFEPVPIPDVQINDYFGYA